MTENGLISDQIVKIPSYFLPGGTIVLDGDIYKVFNYSSIIKFRKKDEIQKTQKNI